MNEEDKQRMMIEYIEEKQPSNPLTHSLAFAYLKGKLEITQKQYAETVDVSARTLRGYISDNRVAYEKELKRAVEEVKAGKPEALAGRLLTEDQLDVFVESLVNAAINPKASVRDRQLLIDLLGVDGKSLLELQDTKRTTLRWWIKGNISTLFRKGLDTREIGIMLETSDLLQREDKEAENNGQQFVDMDIEDEGFKLEMIYFGLLFTSMYNQIKHPDLEVVATAVRLDRLERGVEQIEDVKSIRPYAEGKDSVYTEPKPMTEELYLQFIEEIAETEAEYEQLKQDYSSSIKTVKPPKIDREDVRERQSKHEKELQVFVTHEEWLKGFLGVSE